MSTLENTQVNAIRQYASRLFKPEELIEYRAKTADGSFRGLYFTDQQRLAEVVASLDSDGRALVSYVCINPLKQRLIRERGLTVNPTDDQVNQILAGPPGKTARDEDIEIIRWMFVDVDTVRAPHLSVSDKKEFDRLQHECSTDEEKAAAKAVAQKVLAYLGEKGWPQPLLCDSGNGFHILFHVNLQNTPFNVNQVADCLKALKQQFASESAADIDSSVYNPARLTRAYGSTTRKGTDTPERPYRRNRILSTSPVGDVTLDNILHLSTLAPGYSKHSDGDMPELDPSFQPQDWLDHFEKQGAFEIEGEKEWQGKPILATSVCLYAGHHHTGAEFKSGFIIGDTFGYRCFSDDCEGKTIKEIYKWLREAVDDQGNPLYSPYDKPIYKTDTLDELREVFEWVDLNELDKQQEAENAVQALEVAPEPVEPTVEPGEPEVNKKRLKVGRIKDLAGWMVGSIFRDPNGVLPKFRLLKSHIDSTLMEFIEAPIHETLSGILGFFEDIHTLPSKSELLNWMDESNHNVAKLLRGKDYFDTIRAYVQNLEDDPSKEFAVMATELDRATKLESQKRSTNKNYKQFLKEGSLEDVQAFRIAERKHAQKELRSKGDILGKPLQQMTEVVSAEFLKDVEGGNDAGKIELGFPAIDHHSKIGLHGERTICIYGPANVGKTTLLMTIAVNMAMSGKNVLVLIGEHQAIPMMKTLTLMLGPTVKDDPEIGVLPDRDAWEGINRTATMEDWTRINKLLEKLRDRLILPGWLGAENISAIAGVEEDRLGACVDYIHSFHMTYPLDAVIIDPLDQVMPLSAMGKSDAWAEGVEVLQSIQALSRSFEGRSGKGLMIITSVQFNSKMQREIEKNQAKTAIGDNMDDVILSLMSQMSQVQFYTTIPQHLDTMIGIVTRLKGGNEGYLVHGRFRFGSTFKNVPFVMDPVAHIITTKGVATYAAAAAAPASNTVDTMEAYDTL